MNKLNQVTVRRIISAVVAFLLCLFTTAAALLAVVSVVTSKQYINYTVKASDYSTKAADILTVNLNDLAIPSGLGEEFFSDKVSSQEISEIAKQCINKNYAGAAFSADTEKLKAELIGYFKEYAQSDMIASDVQVTDEALSTLADMCIAEYTKAAAPDIFRYIALYSGKLFKFSLIGFAGTAMLTALSLWFLIKLNKGEPLNLSYPYFSFCSAGISLTILPTILLIGKIVNRLSISTKSVYDFVCMYLNNALWLCVILGIILLLISVALLLVKKRKHNTDTPKNTIE